MKKLIVNADDFGLSESVNASIEAACRQGIVTAATCLVNLAGLDHASRLASRVSTLDLGLHLNLTWGSPVSRTSLPHLAPHGNFRSKRSLALALLLSRIPTEEVLTEAREQLDRFESRFGPASHIDVHQHLHVFPTVLTAVLQLARDRAVPYIRWPGEIRPGGGPAIRGLARVFRRRPRPSPPLRTTGSFLGLALPGRLDIRILLDLLTRIPDGITELMVHPGPGETTPGVPDRLGPRRARERDALMSDAVKRTVESEGIRLTTFRAES